MSLPPRDEPRFSYSQIALACYDTARRRAKTTAELIEMSRAAFVEALSLGRD